MIEFEHTEVVGWEAAIRGMRNSWNSHEKSDSGCIQYDPDTRCILGRCEIGPNDLTLMKQLAGAGSSHAKYRRYINVTVDITAPLYWWKEFDTYKVGTVANSESTMHTISKRDLTLDDFSHDHIYDDMTTEPSALKALTFVIDTINQYRQLYKVSGAKGDWWQIIQLLPSSFNQKRTVQLNYEVLSNIYHARKNHKLTEWREFCRWIESLPYSELITGGAE
jgi:hypothetical protein